MEEGESRDIFNSDLNIIQPDLFNKTEEEAVKLSRNKYNRYGFQFEESVPGLDFINVTAPNGESERIAFGLPGMPRSAQERLVSFMNTNMIEDTKKINELAKANYLDTTIFDDQEAIQAEAKGVEDEAQKIQEGLKAYRSLQIQLSMAESKGNSEDVDRLTSEIRDIKQDMQNQQGALNRQVRRLSGECWKVLR